MHNVFREKGEKIRIFIDMNNCIIEFFRKLNSSHVFQLNMSLFADLHTIPQVKPA